MKSHATTLAGTLFLLIALPLSGCGDGDRDHPADRAPRAASPRADTSGIATAYPQRKGSVYFRLKNIDGAADTSGTRSWLAIYQAQGKTARFQLDLKLPGPAKPGQFAAAQGRLFRVRNSDPSILLGDIAKALGAVKTPQPKRRIDSLTLPMVVLGTGMSRASDSAGGHLASEPEGNWIATKVFAADGDAEFFLNLNLVDGWGEIAIKDSGYGNAVVDELAEVL